MIMETMGLEWLPEEWPKRMPPTKRHASGLSLAAPQMLQREARLTDIELVQRHDERHWTQLDRRGQHPMKPDPGPAQHTPAMPL